MKHIFGTASGVVEHPSTQNNIPLHPCCLLSDTLPKPYKIAYILEIKLKIQWKLGLVTKIRVEVLS